MSVEHSFKHFVARVGDKLVVTDIDTHNVEIVRQCVYSATVAFADLEAAVVVRKDMKRVTLDFEGCETDGFYDDEDDIPDARRRVALEAADMLEADGVIVMGRPVE